MNEVMNKIAEKLRLAGNAALAWAQTFRLKTFATIVSGAYASGLAFAASVNIRPEAQTKVAIAFAVVAAFCYVLTPNRREGTGASDDSERFGIAEQRDSP